MKKVYANLDDFAPWEIEAYADGEALPHVAAFFDQQPATWQAWQQEHQWERQLTATLHRFDCPTPEMLHAYHWQELSAPEQQQLEAHLKFCPHCALELTDFQAFLHEEIANVPVQIAPADQNQTLWEQLQALADQARLVVATLITPISLQFAGVALRSDPTPTLPSSSQTPLLFETDDASGNTAISLMVQRQSTATLRLAGQLLTPMPVASGTAKLTAADPRGAVIQTPLDDVGNFVVAPLQPGVYQLRITLPDQAIIIPNLTLA